MKPKGLVLIVVFAFLVITAGYYVFFSDGFNRESSLVGDATCGSLTSDSAQDKCCVNLHLSDDHIQCMGDWKYDSSSQLCSFVCTAPYLDIIRASSKFSECVSNLTTYYSNPAILDYNLGLISIGFREGYRDDVSKVISEYSLSINADHTSFVYVNVTKGDELKWVCTFLVDSRTSSKVSFVEPTISITGSGNG